MKRYLIPGLVCALMGFTLALEVRTLTLKDAMATAQTQSTEAMVTQLLAVSKERDRLQEELRVLKDMATQQANRSRLQEQVRQEGAASGLIGVTGRGVIVTLNDTRSTERIHVADVLLVLNELRASGAEAIAVNDVRLTERTRITEVRGGGIAIDGALVAGQVVVTAVGDPQVLAAALLMRGGVVEYLKAFYPVSLMDASDLMIPPVAGDLSYRHARAMR